jgi:hypothetical protein
MRLEGRWEQRQASRQRNPRWGLDPREAFRSRFVPLGRGHLTLVPADSFTSSKESLFETGAETFP